MEEINGQDGNLISVVVPTTGDGSLPRLRQTLAIQTLPLARSSSYITDRNTGPHGRETRE